MNNVEIKGAIELSEKINSLLNDAKKVVPYNINVIDELHAKENAHSRILCKLLQYQDVNGNYRILNSFIHYIAQFKPSFANIVIKHPIITQEKKRIDLWIRDYKYAIILENKVCGANDQHNQLERYINTTKSSNHRYKDEQIYIIYLPADEHDPSEQSWGAYKSNCTIKEENYANVSFKYTILPWLKTDVLPFCTLRENILSSAIKQYIDYLEGMYGQRISQQNLYSMKPEWLKELGLEGDFPSQLPKINKWVNNLNETKTLLVNYRDKIINKFVEIFIELSLKILHEYYSSTWGKRGNIYQGWYFFYSEEWFTGSSVHIEWSELDVNDIFIGKSTEYVIKLHVEGGWILDKEYVELLKQNLGSLYRKEGKTTYWSEVYYADKPMGIMNPEELGNFLKNIYINSELKTVIDAISKSSDEYKILKSVNN